MAKKEMHGSELIIAEDGTLYHINLKRADNIPTNVFFVGDPGRVEAAFKYFDKGVEFRSQNREFITAVGHYKGVPMAVMSTGIGTDNVEIASVELHALWEFDHVNKKWIGPPAKKPNIIRIGTAGCPQKDIPVGSLAITEHAIGLDNTGRFYPCQSIYPYMDDLQRYLNSTTLGQIPVYVSMATISVVEALKKACREIGLNENMERGYYAGLTSSASGFYSPQGRQIGRLPILIPDLQEILSAINYHGIKVVDNEMEASSMCRILGDCLGYNVGVICAVLANRNTGEFVPPEEYTASVDRAIRVALIAMKNLAKS